MQLPKQLWLGDAGRINKISFSDCGEYVIAVQERANPFVFRLPSWSLTSKWVDSSLVDLQTVLANKDQMSTSRSHAFKLGETNIFSSGRLERRLGQEQMVRSSDKSLQSHVQEGKIEVSSNEGSVKLHRTHHQGIFRVKDSLLLTRLPAWAGVDDLDVDVKLPSRTDENVQIVLNKATKAWNDISEPVDQHLPAIVTRQKSSIQPPTTGRSRLPASAAKTTIASRLPVRAKKSIGMGEMHSPCGKPKHSI